MSLLTATLLLAMLVAKVTSEDEYVQETILECVKTKSSYYCSKYRFLKFIEDFDLEFSGTGVVNVMRMSENISQYPLACTRYEYVRKEVEFMKFWKFLQRRMCLFFTKHAPAVQTQGGMKTGEKKKQQEIRLDLGRQEVGRQHLTHKDKKKLKILSKVIMFKLWKIKIILSLVLLVVMKSAKIILIALLVYPIIYNKIRSSCDKANSWWWG